MTEAELLKAIREEVRAILRESVEEKNNGKYESAVRIIGVFRGE